MTRGQQLAVAFTCLLAAVTYAGTVTTWAMALFVLPGVAGAAVLATLLASRRMSTMAIGVVGPLVLGWAELANIWTGTSHGPAARSTAVAAGCTLGAVLLAHSGRPALFLAGVAGVVVGAMVLGAAGEVRIVVVAVAVCAALTLGWIERSRRNLTAPPRRGIAVVLLSLLAGSAATGAVLLQAQTDPRDPALLAQDVEQPRFTPAWTDPLGTASKAPVPTAAQDSVSSSRPTSRPAAKDAVRADPARNQSRSIWLYVVVAIGLVVLLVAALLTARLLSTRLAWRRVRRRLAAGTPSDQVTGAWAWTRMRLEACRLPLPADVSPDLVVAGRARAAVPTYVHTPLQALAAGATTAAFSHTQAPGAAEVAAAWTAAGKAAESARELLTRRSRARLAFRGPVSTALREDEEARTPDPQEVVTARRSRTTRQAAIIVAASGLVLCFAILAGFSVFNSREREMPTFSTPTKAAPTVSTATKPAIAAPTVTTPTTPRKPVPPTQAPSQVLAPGDIGSQVTILQRALAALGFSTGKPDGEYGPATQMAVARFQASQGLPQVGVVGPQTLAALQQALSRRSRR